MAQFSPQIKDYPKLSIPFYDSIWIILYFIRFKYLLSAILNQHPPTSTWCVCGSSKVQWTFEAACQKSRVQAGQVTCLFLINQQLLYGSSVHYWCQRPWEHINRFLAVSRFRGTYQRFWAFVETYPLIKMMIRIMIEINLLKRRNMIPILNSQHITGN